MYIHAHGPSWSIYGLAYMYPVARTRTACACAFQARKTGTGLVSVPDPTHYAEKGLLVVLNQQARDLHVRMRYACIDILSECTETSLLYMSV